MSPLRVLRASACYLLSSLILVSSSTAQIVTHSDLPEKPRLEIDPNVENGRTLAWFGRDGFSYFLQTTTDLVSEPWQYLPVIETGHDAELQYGLVAPSPRFFARVVLSEQTDADPLTADFDGDGISNADEFTHRTDPLNHDTDGDGISDGWEIAHSLSPTDSANALLDSDGDGASDYAEFSRGTNPHVPDPVVGVGILIKGLASEDSGIVEVGPTGVALVREGNNYRVWAQGRLSDVLFFVPPPAPEEDTNPHTTESYSRIENAWVNGQGWTVYNFRAYDYISDEGDGVGSWEDWEATTRSLDEIRIVNPASLAAATIPLPTYTWTSFWDGYLYPEHHSYRVGKVHGVDNDGYIWAELAPNDIDERGIYKIPLANPSAPILTDYAYYGFRGVTRTGLALGQMAGQGTNDYSVNGAPVDYEPLFAGDGGAVWGKRYDLIEISPGVYQTPLRYRVYFPDGVSMLAPDFGDFSESWATRLDPWNRLHGYYAEAGTARQVVWERKDLGNSTYEWVRGDYQTLTLGNGQWTDHRVPPGLWEPQGGFMYWINEAGGEEGAPTVFIPGGIAADANSDGVIGLIQEDDSDATYPGRPLRFGVNDDDDAPGSSPQTDYSNGVVDGPDDLADFFPVFLDIKALLTVVPPDESVKYKLKQADGGLNFVYTNLTRATAFDYKNTAPATTGYGPAQDKAAHEAPTHPITATGFDLFELAPDLVTRIKDHDQGVILVEGSQLSDQPLFLTVEKDETIIAKLELPLIGARFEPRPGMVQKGWDAYLEKGTPWTSVVASEQGQVAQQGQVARFHVASAAAASKIGFEVAEAGRAYLLNVDSAGRLLTAPGGAVFTLGGTHTDVPIYAAPQTGARIWVAEIFAKIKTPDGTLTTKVASLKVCILAKRTLKLHLYKIIDEGSPDTEFTQMPTMTRTLEVLNEIYSQAGIHFIGGKEKTLDSTDLGLHYDSDTKNGKLDHPASVAGQDSEWEKLQNSLRAYIQDPDHHDAEEIRADFFAFIYKQSARPADITLTNNQPYYQRGGNITGLGTSGSQGREYGPFVASVGSNSSDELAAVIGHEIGHGLNVTFNDTPLPTNLDAGDVQHITNQSVKPSLRDDEPNSSRGHDNFNFPDPDFPNDADKLIWSFMRAGIYQGEVRYLDTQSRSLRKIFWAEMNLRAEIRLNPVNNP